jgi:MmyB-like transcription regulator ligand binding domain
MASRNDVRAEIRQFLTTRRATPQRVRPSVRRLLDSMTGTAAFLRNGRLDVLAANQLGSALYAPAFGDPIRPVNLARFIFLDPKSTEFYRDWGGIAHAAVGSLRAEAGRAPEDRALTELVGELSVHSQEFRVRWAAHDVHYYRSGTQPFRHPLDLDPGPGVGRRRVRPLERNMTLRGQVFSGRRGT